MKTESSNRTGWKIRAKYFFLIKIGKKSSKLKGGTFRKFSGKHKKVLETWKIFVIM